MLRLCTVSDIELVVVIIFNSCKEASDVDGSRLSWLLKSEYQFYFSAEVVIFFSFKLLFQLPNQWILTTFFCSVDLFVWPIFFAPVLSLLSHCSPALHQIWFFWTFDVFATLLFSTRFLIFVHFQEIWKDENRKEIIYYWIISVAKPYVHRYTRLKSNSTVEHWTSE